MKKYYFVADAHLRRRCSQSKKRQDQLVQFLQGIKENALAIFLMGDLFDFWFEYYSVVPKGFHRLLCCLRQITASGVPVYYLAGNHDFWLGDFLEREVGLEVNFQPIQKRIGCKQCLMLHGDGLAPFEFGYRLLKRILRSRIFIHLFRLIHPDLGLLLASGASKISGLFTKRERLRIIMRVREVYRREAFKLLKPGIDAVILGHTHYATVEQTDRGVYVNCGSWLSKTDYIEFDGERFIHKHFKDR